MTREGVRHPRVLVCPVPQGNSDASIDGLACRDHIAVVGLLLGELRLSGGEGHTNVELGDGDLDARGGERFELLLEVSRHLADDEVALEADAVQGHVGGLERLDEVQE